MAEREEYIVRRSLKWLSTGAALAAMAHAGSADAAVTSADATGYGLSADLSLLILNLSLPPQALAAGTAPTPFSELETALSAQATIGGLASLSTGVLTGTASSNVDGSAGARTADASGTVDGLNLSVVFGTVLSMSATTIGSNAQVNGDYGALSGAGSSILEDLDLTVLGSALTVDANAAANTVLFDALGIRIVLNEQIVGGDGVSGRSMEVNAIRITFDDVAAGLGLLNGDIRIGHSFASMNAIVPAPATGGLAAAVGVLAARRRRRT